MKKTLIISLALFPLVLPAQNTMVITAGASFTTSGGVVVTLQDMDLQMDGDINQLSGNGTFRFSGAQNNTISGSTPPLFDILEMAKTGAAKLSLQRSITIGSSLKFTSGLLDLNINNITLNPTASLTGETETSRLTGTNGGYIQITTSLNAPSSANPGNLGAVITSTQNLGSTVIRRGHAAQTDGGTPNFNIQRYYDITPTNNANLNATLRINYFDAELNGKVEANLSVWKSIDNINWTSAGFSNRNTASNFVEANNFAAFGRWTLSDKVATGIFDLPSGRNSIRVWPNPYTDMFTVGIESTRATKATVQVFDMTGKMIYTQPILIAQGKNNLPVRLSSFAKGIYQLKVIGMEGSVAVIPIMKQ